MNVQQLPAAASVSFVAQSVCKLSRSRFYDLLNAGIFPKPVRHPSSSRPIYNQELIEKCLQIRRTGIGNDGQPVLFNRKLRKPGKPKQGRNSVPHSSEFDELIDDLKSFFGLTTTPNEVAQAVRELFPDGLEGKDKGDILTELLRYLQTSGTSK